MEIIAKILKNSYIFRLPYDYILLPYELKLPIEIFIKFEYELDLKASYQSSI